MLGCTQGTKANAHKALVRPFLECACAVWNPYTVHDIALLELVQNRAAIIKVREVEVTWQAQQTSQNII